MNQEVKHYDSIDGLRAIAAVGIAIMHMRANNNYDISGGVYHTIIPFFTEFIFLFIIISGFSMCCGYYEKIQNNQISMEDFYRKRYVKIWPFFAILVVLDAAMSPSLDSLVEALADFTLCFGLLPNAKITVIGVGWTIGVIFLFYMLFPFFCFLIKNKKRAWLSMLVAVFYNIACTEYFFNRNHVVDDFVPRRCFIFCTMFFLAGGLIYLYRYEICGFVEKHKYVTLILCLAITVTYFILVEPKVSCNRNIVNIWMLIMFAAWLMYAIGTENIVLKNPVTKFLSGISMEIYLSHMMIFRIVEKLHLQNLAGNGWGSYIITCVLVVAGATVFSTVAKKCINKVIKPV